MNHLHAFVPLGPDFMGYARWRSQKRGKDWGFSAGLSVPDREDHVYTSPKLPGTGSNMRKSSTGDRPNAVELILRDTLLIQHTWNGTYCKSPPLSTTLPCKSKGCFMAQPGKRRGHAIASHFGRLWVSSWHVWSQLCTCEGCTTRLVSLSLLLTHRLPALYLSALGSVLHREGTWPLVSHLQTCSVVKGDFFAFLYSGFSWISHPYLWCRTESCWTNSAAFFVN